MLCNFSSWSIDGIISQVLFVLKAWNDLLQISSVLFNFLVNLRTFRFTLSFNQLLSCLGNFLVQIVRFFVVGMGCDILRFESLEAAKFWIRFTFRVEQLLVVYPGVFERYRFFFEPRLIEQHPIKFWTLRAVTSFR